jgi:predicted metal-binding membrane protein
LLNRAVAFLGNHPRQVTLAAVLLMAAAGWSWLIRAVVKDGMAGAVMPAMAEMERGSGLAMVFAMWAAMVFAMMLPTAAPTFRAYSERMGYAAFALIGGYTSVWLGIAVLATAGQTWLGHLGALAPRMAPAGVALSASILMAAGIYQFTPLKRACLVRCRNPRVADIGGGAGEAFRVGVEEGFACLGCCWAMMAVMFAAGLMNLAAMALLGALMGGEKLASGHKATYFLGVLLIIAGVVLASGLVIR